MANNMEEVELATMLPGATRVVEASVNSVWKAPVLTSSGQELVAFVKVIPDRDLFVECACAVIGRQLGLPIPKPLIVYPEHEIVKESGEALDSLAFGSVDVEHPSFLRYLNGTNLDIVWEKLEKAGLSVSAGIFDEWIANADRHQGNILYASDKEFWLIDHQCAMQEWLPYDSLAVCNQILENTTSIKSDFEKHSFLKTAREDHLPKYKLLALAVLSDKVSGDGYLGESDIQAVVDFLQNRITVMITLLRDRVRIEQTELALK